MRRLGILSAALLLQLALASSVFAGASATHGYSGSWETIDCAQWWEDGHVDCGVYGDGSRQTLNIGRGDTPRISFADDYATSCVNAGSRSARWVGSGYGYYDGGFLWVVLTRTGCGTYQQGSTVEAQLYYDQGSDTIWEDEDGDGWGWVYRRSH